MPGFEGLGKSIIVMGLILVLIGAVMAFGGKLLGLGRLPGDIYVKRGNFTFYFPLVTCIVVSLVLTLIFSVLGRR